MRGLETRTAPFVAMSWRKRRGTTRVGAVSARIAVARRRDADALAGPEPRQCGRACLRRLARRDRPGRQRQARGEDGRASRVRASARAPLPAGRAPSRAAPS
jgi:hypothetical protein